MEVWHAFDPSKRYGGVLYALEIIEQTRPLGSPFLWKLGRTFNLDRRIREMPSPAVVRYVRELEDDEDPIRAELDILRLCPFPSAGGGRELFRATGDAMWQWLIGEGDVECRQG